AERYFGNVDAIDFTEPSFDLNKLKTDYDILYLNGGNIFYLEKAIREHDFAEAINFFIENKLFIGESAGAAILGIDIYPLRHLDDIDAVENASKKGLEIVKFNILPHYDNNELAEQIKLAEKDFLSSSADLLTINEKQGVITDGEEIIGYE
ncbi:Type 1 glutamine amidotransferase-like domain-containing protein, partial [Candidatus Dojkabacteria bacterium]|nr:Type 1 glutamine amidotransferase-like domain-containing protein [Candidatus Dojkabacteria bacterium]